MIRVVVYDNEQNGLWPYRVDGHWGPGGAPLIGIAEDPIAEACRVLQALGVELGTRIRIEAPRTRLGPISASGLLGNFLKKTVGVLPLPQKALPAPRKRVARAAGKRIIVKGSGIPGDE